MILKKVLKISAAVAVMCTAADADVFDWINSTESTAKWDVSANWQDGNLPVIHSSATTPCWEMTNSVIYLTNEVPFVQQINIEGAVHYWNGYMYGELFSDRYHRIMGTYAPVRRHTINDARGFKGFITSRNSTSTSSTADDGPMLIVHDDFTNALPQFYVQNYQRVSAYGNTFGREMAVRLDQSFGAGLFRVGDDYGNANDGGYFKSANVTFDFGELQTGREGHMVLKAYANVSLHGRTNDAPAIAAGAALHLDASNGGTLDIVDGKVTAWRDVDGGAVSASAIGSPVLGTSTNGLAVVKCPSGSAFRLPSAIDAREIFLVFRQLNARNAKPPAFVGNSSGNKEFLRHASTGSAWGYLYQGLFAGGDDAKHLEAGEVWYDGTRTLPAGLYDDFTRALHVVSGSLYDSTAPVEFIGAETDSTNVGGIELAEVLIYSKELTSAERRDVNSYLRAKWQSADVAADWDLGSLSVPNPKTNHGKFSVEDGRFAVREVSLKSSQTTFAKEGAGTLEVGRLSPEGMSIEVNGGALAFRNPDGEVKKEMAADPSVWLDASQPSTFVPDPTDPELVCKWNDPRGTNHRGQTIYATNTTHMGVYGRSPAIVHDTPTGKAALDFGEGVSGVVVTNVGIGTAGAMKISSANFREGFMVVKATGPDFITFSTGSWDLFNGNASSFLALSHCASAIVGGYWTVNGKVYDTVDRSYAMLSTGTYYVIGMRPAGAWYTNMDKLGVERNTTASDNIGGVSIAEVVYYDRILTPKERRDTEAYLMDKWLGEEHPDALAQSIAVPAMTFADGVPAVIDTDVDMTIGELDASGAVVKKGAGKVTLSQAMSPAVTSVDVEGGALAVSFRPNLVAAATIHLDASKTNFFDFAEGGTDGEIAAWRDCDGRTSYYAKSERSYTNSKTGVTVTLTNGVLRTTGDGSTGLLAGKEYVSFGNAHQVAADTPIDGGGMRFVNNKGAYVNIENVREMHYVFRRTQVNNNPVIGSAGYTSDQIVPAGSSSPKNMFYGGCKIACNSPKRLDEDAWHADNWWLASHAAPDVTQFYVCTISFTNSMKVNSIALDRNITCGWGGIDLCELLIYTGETNTQANADMIHSWLMNKWKGMGEVSTLPAELAGLSVTGGGSLAADVDDSGRLQVGEIALDVVFDAAGGWTQSAVSGAVELPASGTVRVLSTGGASPAPGDYAVLTAGALSGSVGGWTLDVSAMSTARRYALLVRDGSVILRVTQPGSVMLIR